MTPLERYRKIDEAARKFLGDDSASDSDSFMELDRLVFRTIPDPDIALVEVRRIRTEKGEKTCATDYDFCSALHENRGESGLYCSFISGLPPIKEWHPHPDCPVWKDQ